MDKTISVYFNDTDFKINNLSQRASNLYNITIESESQIKFGFNGCGIDYGFFGKFFGSGLDKQCETVINCIIQEINKIKDGHHITLNVYGHKRGGIAALLLAKQLGIIDIKKLVINLALYDPVPGNYITTSFIDPFKISLANKTMDLRDCKPLSKVLALYPYITPPDIPRHAPLLVYYPQKTMVEEEVVNGCHEVDEKQYEEDLTLADLRIHEFLAKNGTQLEDQFKKFNNAEHMKNEYIDSYQQALNIVVKSRRDTHSSSGKVITANHEGKYLNNHHKALCGGSPDDSVCLRIEPKKGLFSRFRNFFSNYPLVGQLLKWTLITLSVASLLYFTGGLAVLPLLIPIVVKFGSLSILAISPLIGGILATLWYSAAKPILSWAASKFFYPHYAIRNIEAPKVETTDSNRALFDTLGEGNSAMPNSTITRQVPKHIPSPLDQANTSSEANNSKQSETMVHR